MISPAEKRLLSLWGRKRQVNVREPVRGCECIETEKSSGTKKEAFHKRLSCCSQAPARLEPFCAVEHGMCLLLMHVSYTL